MNDARQVRGVIDRLVRDGTAVARSNGAVHALFPVAIGSAEGEAVRTWVTRTGATQTTELVEFHSDESMVVLPRFLADGQRFDLAFVDGNHRFDSVFVDLVYLGRLVRPGGIVFIDDYQLPAIARATSFFTTNLGWKTEELSVTDHAHHWAVFRTSFEADTRRFDEFVDF